MSTGIEAKIGVGREATWGTGVASTRFITAREGITDDRGRLREDMVFGTRSTLPADPGRARFTGGFTDIPGRPQTVGEFLRAALGVPTTSGAGPFVHVFKAKTTKFSEVAALPPYSATIKRRADLIDQFVGGQLSQLELRQPVDDALMLNADFLWKDVEAGSDETVTLDAGERFRYKHLKVLKGGNPFPYLIDLTLTINNNLDPEETLNETDVISAVDFGDKLAVTLALTASFRDKSLIDEFRAGTADEWQLTWTTAGGAILDIAIPHLALDSAGAPIEGPGRITLSASGTAEYDSVAGHEIEITLTNEETSYA